jgi:hypothetical protein
VKYFHEKNMKMNKMLSEENLWKLAAAGSAVIAGTLVRSLVAKGWKATTDKNPPVNQAPNDTNWQEAITWTIATSVAIGIAQLVAKQGTHARWINTFGKELVSRKTTLKDR